MVDGKYIGIRYDLRNAGFHNLSDFLESEEAKEEIEKLTKQLFYSKTKIDIDGDGKVDVSLASLNLTTKNLLSEKGAITEGGKIQLNPDVLKTLSNNIKTSVMSDLEEIIRITNLCIEKTIVSKQTSIKEKSKLVKK